MGMMQERCGLGDSESPEWIVTCYKRMDTYVQRKEKERKKEGKERKRVVVVVIALTVLLLSVLGQYT